MTKEQQECPYCHDKEDLLQKYDDKVYIVDGDVLTIDPFSNEAEFMERKINYCPMCGRKL